MLQAYEAIIKYNRSYVYRFVQEIFSWGICYKLSCLSVWLAALWLRPPDGVLTKMLVGVNIEMY